MSDLEHKQHQVLPRSGSKTKIVIQVSLKEHLADLISSEGKKPLSQRREVPNIAELVRVTGVGRATLYNMANNKNQTINLGVLSEIMSCLCNQGFPTEISDLLRAYPIPDHKA